MGAEPEVLPGGVEGQDTRHAAHLGDLWGCELPAAGGFDAAEMIEAAHNDRLKALVLLDIDPLFHFPDTRWVEDALARLDCIITLGKFDTGQSGHTHFLLPTASVHEQAGTFTSGEGRLQYFESAARMVGSARTVRAILSDLAGRLGHTWDFPSAQSVFHEMGRAIGALEGMSHVSLRGSVGRVLDLGQYRQEAASLMESAADALGGENTPAAAPEGQYLLVTGNIGHHFGHLTHESEPIMNFASVPYALLHPEDCEALSVDAGHWIAVTSDRGRIDVTARPSPLVARGMIVVPVHYPDANPNRLRDRNRAADYVRIERVKGKEKDALQPNVAIAEVGTWTF